jgi:Spy/CpxP family protein refolding chaperone
LEEGEVKTMLAKLFLAGALAATMAWAQGGMGGGGGRNGGAMGDGDAMERSMGSMGNRSTNRLDMLSDMLKLDKDQKKQLKSIMDEGQKDATPVKEEIIKARTNLADAIAAGKSPDDLKPLETACAAAAAHVHQVELSAFARIYQILDKDQQAKAAQLFAMMSGVFHGKNWTEMN